MTVTSGLLAQAETTSKQTEERATRTSSKNKQTNRGERATFGGGLDQDPKSGDRDVGL